MTSPNAEPSMVTLTSEPSSSWWTLFAPAAAWSLQELASAAISAELCAMGARAYARPLLVLLSAGALAVTVTCTLRGYRLLRSPNARESVANTLQNEGRERHEMLALATVVVGAVLSLAVLWGALPAFMLGNLCGARR